MPSVLAIVAHPDDIEYLCAGTLLRLFDLGWDLHYVNLCDGSKGSTTMDRETCARVRLDEARAACKVLGAKLYPPIYPDMEAAYTNENLRRVAAYVRQAKPSIILTHSPIDYMEDHETACRLAVSAAFTHAMPNFETDPPEPIYKDPVTVYHAQPLNNRLPLGEEVKPHFYVDTTRVIDRQIESLACHASQNQWLDESQGVSNYLEQLKTLAREVGSWSGRYEYAEGWRRHNHMGFCGPDDDPLRDALA
jgi:N-acetylglucosamine malate deacetylase 1